MAAMVGWFAFVLAFKVVVAVSLVNVAISYSGKVAWRALLHPDDWIVLGFDISAVDLADRLADGAGL